MSGDLRAEIRSWRWARRGCDAQPWRAGHGGSTVAIDAIQLRGLAKRFGDFHAVALFDLTVRAQTAFPASDH